MNRMIFLKRFMLNKPLWSGGLAMIALSRFTALCPDMKNKREPRLKMCRLFIAKVSKHEPYAPLTFQIHHRPNRLHHSFPRTDFIQPYPFRPQSGNSHRELPVPGLSTTKWRTLPSPVLPSPPPTTAPKTSSGIASIKSTPTARGAPWLGSDQSQQGRRSTDPP